MQTRGDNVISVTVSWIWRLGSHIPSLFVCLSITILYPTGCSLIGAGIGAAVSNRNDEISAAQEISLKPGEPVVVVSKSGSRTSGTFLQTRPLPHAVYAKEYQEYLRDSGEPSFSIGDTVTITFRRGITARGERTIVFAGFDTAGRIKDGGSERVLWYSLEDAQTLRGSDGVIIDGPALYHRLLRCEIPLDRSLSLRVGDQDTTFHLFALDSLYKESGGSGALIGFAVGAVIDVAVIVAVYACNELRSKAGAR